jgi:hypothetical protein
VAQVIELSASRRKNQQTVSTYEDSLGGATTLRRIEKCIFILPKQFKPGDRVQWNTPQGKTTGKVKKKLTSAKKIKGHVAKASRENPGI